MSILKPINYAGAWEFKSPVPAPVGDILGGTQVSIAFNSEWTPAVFSALKALTRPEAWLGTLADIQRATSDAHNLFDVKVRSGMRPGTILLNLTQTWPANWLACDGNTYLRETWPELYAVLHSSFIIDADHFFVPNLRGRIPIVAGSGAGLTPRVIGQSGGEEGHVLTTAELAVHSHPRDASGKQEGTLYNEAGALGYAAGAFGGEFLTQGGNAGSGASHNNMPPFYVVQFSIVASSD